MKLKVAFIIHGKPEVFHLNLNQLNCLLVKYRNIPLSHSAPTMRQKVHCYALSELQKSDKKQF